MKIVIIVAVRPLVASIVMTTAMLRAISLKHDTDMAVDALSSEKKNRAVQMIYDSQYYAPVTIAFVSSLGRRCIDSERMYTL